MIQSLILITALFSQLPTHKIEAKVDSTVLYVRCDKPEDIVKILTDNNIRVVWVVEAEGKYLVGSQWNNYPRPYKEVRDVFFKLAKRKDVYRIY